MPPIQVPKYRRLACCSPILLGSSAMQNSSKNFPLKFIEDFLFLWVRIIKKMLRKCRRLSREVGKLQKFLNFLSKTIGPMNVEITKK
jgi:hypothetical protein